MSTAISRTFDNISKRPVYWTMRHNGGIIASMINAFDIGDHIVMKKPHACGANEWAVTRTGADVKLKCTGCGRLVMLDRVDFLKSAKKNLGKGASNEPDKT